MIAAPAVDLQGGRCVQLVGGRPDDVRVSLPDPVAQAEQWYERGFGTLHVVDLDAALGTGDNLDLIIRIVTTTPAETQVGGGIRDVARARELLGAGVDRIVVGTRALDDPDWLAGLAGEWPGRVMVALDTRHGRILRKGWTEETGLDLASYLPGLSALSLAGILATDVGREGRLEGIDREAVGETISLSPHPLWASGGVTTVEELEYLDEAGAAGVVLGMALYTETLDPSDVATRWGSGANMVKDR
ncbi:MAG: 1-(5-phosphoribosyl)-5-[(5-phosphoribosylamino)methylideneamino] imidazole-4-carboxamide isomerase [Gemmatimonadota bacterium]|nr:1-(5-phosphoribosyl)-5-[(5-phosphoribosylamino)methylideneamino] imidazole-4-carboxamide isomerase [Gemmatimonadota bacterium]MDH3421882.1 1-(5-phosphoribosyl)-5-[(5-phosphoribosylamino)methylideneamino] imidazole-4-carboxamide isomerase [Gemmatimonadota bacterium]